ncbi:magnesium-dependent phosphatase 1-like [Macrosteles quadrilineatus]|uniref:magnesium-dependent phosphatase 1-like n=1 Tax=Macrosteles quadrilineatus TaxID=74068 RepID=UPI0023E2719A|nr:magnesium-dependent phosphatase 1-like [Macrosteles quadrilineatus]XP_054290371.1 magnesium-dependent phosphatase 1-like [Macrosteles quadrilineatus]
MIFHPSKQLNWFINHLVLPTYFILLFCDIKCFCEQSVYIQPTHSTEKPKPRIPGELYPRMIIFHMDRTIWPFWFELDVTRPIQNKNGIVLDDGFQPLKPYPQVPGLLSSLHSKGYKLAFVNQSPDNSSIESLLQWFDLNKFITYKITMSAPRKELVRLISQNFKVDCGDILYFDGEYEEIPDIAELGTVCIQTSDKGVTTEDVEKGLSVFTTEAPPP